MQRTSSLFLQNFTAEDKLAFLRYADAWDCVLNPGETLLMPMMAWHFVEYLDASMSVSYRLGRNKYTRFLAEAVPVPSVFLQRLAVEFIDEESLSDQHLAAFELLQNVARQPYASAEERARALDATCMRLCEELDPEWSREYTFYDRQRRELVRQPDEPLSAESQRSGTDEPSVSTPTWGEHDLVSLTPEVMVLMPLADGGSTRSSVVLARHGRLELRLTIDVRRPWLLDMLRAIADGSVFTVGGLAQSCGAAATELRTVLVQLYERGWITAPQASEPAPV